MRRRTFLGALAASATLPSLAAADGAGATGRRPPAFVVDVPGLHEVVTGPDGRYAYGAAEDALVVVDCDAVDAPEVLARVEATMDGTAMTGLVDATIDGDRVLVAGPPGFVDDGQPAGAAVFDVSDPANPQQTATVPTDHAVHNAALDGDTAYLTGYMLPDQPLVAYDLSGDEPSELFRWSVTDENDAWSGVNRSLYQVHDVTVRGDHAYVSYWDAGTWILDVSDRENPEPVTQMGGVDPEAYSDLGREEQFDELGQLPGNAHSTSLSPDGGVLALGREAGDRYPDDDRYGGPGGIGLYDVSDVADPTFLTALQPPVVENADGEKRVATAHNFAFRGDRLYASWYSSGVRAYGVADPENPVDLGGWAAPGEASFWGAAPLDEGFVGASYQDPSAPDEENRDSQNAKLYTFPEPDGEDAPDAQTMAVNATGVPEDPPAFDFRAERQTTTSGGTTDDEATTTSGGTTDDKATTTSGSRPSSTTDGDGGSGTTLGSDGESSGSVPGFGAAVAVAGASLAALHRLRD
jgi:PGF-CTERM protein